MITKTENKRLIELIEILAWEKFRDGFNGFSMQSTTIAWSNLETFIDSITEQPKVYYAVNFNMVGCLPDGEPYDGLENVDEIMDAIDDICYRFEDSDGIDANEELPSKKDTRHFLKSLIAGNKLEHETIGYIGNFCIFVYKDHEYEYRQFK